VKYEENFITVGFSAIVLCPRTAASDFRAQVLTALAIRLRREYDSPHLLGST
jgi:hypothetical protein